MKESDMFEPVKHFLLEHMGCEKVYAEMNNVDVVGVHGNVLIGIEMKTSLNFKVIEQAERRADYVDYMFILVPQPKKRHEQIAINWIKSLGIGLMYYSEKASPINGVQTGVTIRHWGKRWRQDYYKKSMLRCIEREGHIGEVNTGGVKGGESITPYKNTIDTIKHYLYYEKDKGATIEQILNACQTHYARPKPSVVATLQAHWNAEWCEIYIEGKERYFRMKEEYREPYWNEYMSLRDDIRALRRLRGAT